MEEQNKTTFQIQKSEEQDFQITKSYIDKWLTNNSVSVLKESYNNSIIRDLEQTEVNKSIASVIVKDMMLKGVKAENKPNKLITDDIKKMILTKYSVLTLLEIELAFQMERYGELDPKSEHFQFYGTEYVSEILQKFSKWKQKKAIELNLTRYKNDLKQKEVSLDKIDKEYLDYLLNQIKKGVEYRKIESHLFYKQIPPEYLPTKENALILFESERKKLLNEFELKKLNQKDNREIKKITDIFNQTFDEVLKVRCRNIVTCEYLSKKHNVNANRRSD